MLEFSIIKAILMALIRSSAQPVRSAPNQDRTTRSDPRRGRAGVNKNNKKAAPVMHKHTDLFYSAVRTLSGAGSLKKRLVTAYDDNLAHLLAEELPQNIRPSFEKLRVTMFTVKPMGSESPVLATVRKMSTTEANRCANLIVAMFKELNRGKDQNEGHDQPSAPAVRGTFAGKRRPSLN